MTDISPAAQAVLDASNLYPCNDSRQIIAATLRAAADQLFPEPDYWTKDNMSEQGLWLLRLKRDQLLAIAAELENTND
jgi:hypothetical protein